jgi:hypothetical protein
MRLPAEPKQDDAKEHHEKAAVPSITGRHHDDADNDGARAQEL